MPDGTPCHSAVAAALARTAREPTRAAGLRCPPSAWVEDGKLRHEPPAGMALTALRLCCTECGSTLPADEPSFRCACTGTLDVQHAPGGRAAEVSRALFDGRLGSRDPLDRSGVWRFRELLPPLERREIVTRLEGGTRLYDSPRLAGFVRLDALRLKHEGENPTGSFKDRGMSVGISVARCLGYARVACASTGNTSASLASYAAVAGMQATVFIPRGAVAAGKLAQAMAYGARITEIAGSFDEAMRLVELVSLQQEKYLLNSLNPFRLEGQKTLAFELLQDLDWTAPDWIVLPGGNLGNTAALSKGLAELRALGLIARLPRLAVIQAAGANPFYTAWRSGAELVPLERPETVATAIRIGAPVSWRRALRAVRETDGAVEQVADAEILAAKRAVDASGIGAEPASCAAVAGLRKLVGTGVVARDADVCVILTGHLLKDPDAVLAARSPKATSPHRSPGKQGE